MCRRTGPMASIGKVNTGGLAWDIRSSTPIVLAQADPAYQHFADTGTHVGEKLQIQVELELDAMPDLGDAVRLFENEEGRSVFALAGDRWFLQTPVGSSNPVWCAHSQRESMCVTIYCGRQLRANQDGTEILVNPVTYPLDLILTMQLLSGREGIVVHAAGVEIEGKAVVFVGKSGAGKSTLARLFAEQGLVVLSDDRVVVRKSAGEWHAYGTPWLGEAGLARDKRCSVGSVVLLRQGEEDCLRRLDASEVMRGLLPAASIPWYDRDVVAGMLQTCEVLLREVPGYELTFRPTSRVVDVVRALIEDG